LLLDDTREYGVPGIAFTAGTKVPPGRYRRVGGWGREVELPQGGHLPPSFDGQVAIYVQLKQPVEAAK
jgi:hypothetical protein